jgi:uncharacterized integral membrane protein
MMITLLILFAGLLVLVLFLVFVVIGVNKKPPEGS